MSEFKDLETIQAQVEMYRERFFERSRGVKLPEITYIGRFEKTSPQYGHQDSNFFVAIPVKNQEEIIAKVIQTLLENSHITLTIGLLFDNCTDNSFREAINYIKASFYKFPKLMSVHFLTSRDELFESTCENLLFQLCKSKFFVSLQSDIYLEDPTFFDRSLKAFAKQPNLLAISGRAIVPFLKITNFSFMLTKIIRLIYGLRPTRLYRRKHKELGPYIPNYGYFGDISDEPNTKMLYSNKQMNTLYIGNAVIRGPIVWRSETALPGSL